MAREMPPIKDESGQCYFDKGICCSHLGNCQNCNNLQLIIKEKEAQRDAVKTGKGISETAFGSQVEYLLKLFSWRWCHFRPALTGAGWRTAMSGDKGLPDYICVRAPRLVFAELKDETKPMQPEQQEWFDALSACQLALVKEPLKTNSKESTLVLGIPTVPAVVINPEVYLWRPHQIEDIAEILR